MLAAVQGAWEKDEIRKDDSFVTFEEIFDLATSEKVSWQPLMRENTIAFLLVERFLAGTMNGRSAG
jgi:hypothetical protein